MYMMNNDFFDGFTVLFGDGDSIINEKHCHLGSFAVEFLNLGVGYLGDISEQVPILKKAMTVFLSARDPSSAAEAQQALNTLWDSLLQMPVFKLFVRKDMSHQHLIKYLREHPDEADDMITPGTARNRAYEKWIAKLEDFTSSIEKFIRDTDFMLTSYFSELTERNANAYAKAFGHYYFDVRYENEKRQFEQEETGCFEPVPHMHIEFSTITSFVTVASWDKDNSFTLAERTLFEDLSTFLYFELYRGLAAGNVPRRCQHCGKYFLLNSGYDIRYCTNVAPGETTRTCRQVGAHRKEKVLNGSVFVRKEYGRLYNRLKHRKSRGKLSVDEWNRLIAEAQEIKDRAVNGEISDVELKRLFDGF